MKKQYATQYSVGIKKTILFNSKTLLIKNPIIA